MSTDFAAKEAEFIASLQDDTGRDLSGWMAAIGAENFAHRNDAIDWLRQKGFTFSRASWLERIHHNGGKPIYAGGEPRSPAPRRGAAAPAIEPEPPPSPAAAATPEPPPPVAATPTEPARIPAPPPPVSATTSTSAADVAVVVAKAKAYRPLATFLLAEIRRRLPDALIAAHDAHVAILDPAEFAILSVSPKELRLGLALPGRPPDPPLRKAKLPGIGEHITHMIVLTDARQVTPELLALVADARSQVNG